MVGQLMKLPGFTVLVEKAVKAANAIRASHSKWYKRLRDECAGQYGKRPANSIYGVGDTR